ncbi:MAG TPA: energy transducer TonB [Myxococcales bacterium]|nr:energy transducer TonB [Myxococcales bacterium]
MRLSALLMGLAAILVLSVACNKGPAPAAAPAAAPAPVKPAPKVEKKAPEPQKEAPDPVAEKKTELKKLATLATAFVTDDGHEQLLKTVLETAAGASLAQCKGANCSAQELGLKEGHAMSALSGRGETVLRLNQHLKKLGKDAPAGVFELPLPSNDVAELAAAGAPTSKTLPLEVINISEKGVSVTLRPVAKLESDSLVAGGEWPGKQVMDAAALQAAQSDEDFKVLVDAMTALKSEATTAAKAMSTTDPAAAVVKGKWAALLVVDKATSTGVLTAVVKGLGLSGYSDLRYLRGGSDRSVVPIPNSAAFIPADRAGRVEKRALLVNLTEKGADIFDPQSGTGKAAQESQKVPLPKEAQRWYKGARLFKTTVTSLDPSVLVQALRSVKQRSSAGTVVLLHAESKVSAERLLTSASAIADAQGPAAQQKLSDVFPGLVCKDEDPKASSDGCMSLFPVVAVGTKIPAARGLTNKPVKGQKVAPKPKEEPKAKPKLGMCERGNIKSVIRGRRGAFRFCYTRQLQLHQDLQGRVVVRLTINESGRVTGASSSGSMANKKVHACVLKEAKKLHFKPPTEGGRCVVNWPFKFKPND